MLLLDNSMFDAGSIEYRNFTLSTINEYRNVEWNYIKNFAPIDVVDAIHEAFFKGIHYITVERTMGEIIEISWD